MPKVPLERVHEDLQTAAKALVDTTRETLPPGVLCVVILVHNETGHVLVGGNVDEEDLGTVLHSALEYVEEHKQNAVTQH